jgi:hypothetical protein
MTIVKLKGGLGNQLFQYAYGRALELSGEKIIFDTSFFNGNKAKIDTARDFKLNNYNIETKAKFENVKTNTLLDKVLVRLGLKNEFYQGEKYFKNIENNIRKEFTLKNPLSSLGLIWQDKINNSANSVLLHIRRGDYVFNKETNSFHGSLDMDYYEKAIAKIVEEVGNNIELFVFSDDMDWAKENIKFNYPTNFSDPLIKDYEQMHLMSLCKHDIIANSTFSWWGAWLNMNPQKIVIAPKMWLRNKSSAELDILPSGWITI